MTTSLEIRRALEQLTSGWQHAGLPADALAPAVAAMERHDEVQREMQATTNGPDIAGIASRIAAGSLSVQEGAEEYMLAGAAQGAVRAGSGMKVVTVVGDAAKRAALARLVESVGSRDVLDVLVAAGDEVVEAVAKIAPALDGIATAEDAANAGSKVVKAWAELTELGRRHYTLTALWNALEKFDAAKQRPAEFASGATVQGLVARVAV